MFNTDELTAALQNGANPDEIAKSFTDALNTAIKAQKEAEEKAAKKNKIRAERVEALQGIIDAIEDFVEDFYPDMYDAKVFESFDTEELDKVVLEAYEDVKRMAPLFDSLKDLEKQLKMTDNVTKTVAIKKTKSTDQAIADFLRRSGL